MMRTATARTRSRKGDRAGTHRQEGKESGGTASPPVGMLPLRLPVPRCMKNCDFRGPNGLRGSGTGTGNSRGGHHCHRGNRERRHRGNADRGRDVDGPGNDDTRRQDIPLTAVPREHRYQPSPQPIGTSLSEPRGHRDCRKHCDERRVKWRVDSTKK